MGNREVEMVDIVVVLDEKADKNIDDAVAELKQKGVQITDVDADNGVIEGTIDAGAMAQVRKLDFVKYLRSVFAYEAEFPADAARSADAEDADPPEADDAGA